MPKNPKPSQRSSIPEIDESLKQKQDDLKKQQKANTKAKATINVRGHRGKQDHYLTDASIEDDMIAAIDFRKEITQLKPILEMLVKDKFDPTTFFSKVSKFAAAELASVAFTGEKEKNRLDALKHLLALGGHTATQKHEISGRVDPETPKAALMAMIRGSAKDLADEGIEIVDDENYDQ